MTIDYFTTDFNNDFNLSFDETLFNSGTIRECEITKVKKIHYDFITPEYIELTSCNSNYDTLNNITLVVSIENIETYVLICLLKNF